MAAAVQIRTLGYLQMIYLLHVFIFAIPLLYFGITGQLTGIISPFGYTYLTLLGGMAAVYHGYWFIHSIITARIL